MSLSKVVSQVALAGIIAAIVIVAPVSVRAKQPPLQPDAPLGAPADTYGEIHDAAVVAFKARRFEEALAGFDRAISINSKVPLAYYNRGNVRLALKDPKGAIDDFSEAIKLSRDFALAYMNRGSAHSSLGRLDEAITDLNEAVRLDPDASDGYYNRAIVRQKRAEMPGAIDDYLQMLRLDRSVSDDRAQERLVRLMERQGPATFPTVVDRRSYEFGHGRVSEFLLTLIDRSCLAIGQDEVKLAELANSEGWNKIPPSRLKLEANRGALIAAWSLNFFDSAYYVVQSRSEGKVVCSVSTMPVDDHLLGDIKDSLADRFQTKHSSDITSANRLESRYELSTSSALEPRELQVIHRPSVRFVTLRVASTLP